MAIRLNELPVVAAFLIASAGSAWAAQCEFYNAGTGEMLRGECSVDYGADGTVVQIADSSFVFVESSRQGQWTVGTLDGQPAARYEINRKQYSYATLDLKVFIDVTEK